MLRDAHFVSCGLDWLTATSKSSDAYVTLLEHFREWIEAGNVRTEEHDWMGYYGRKSENVFVGAATDSREWAYIYRVSGPTANRFIEFSSLNWRASRIDLQVTLKLPKPTAVAEALYEKMLRRHTGSVSLVTGSDGGSTLYVNSRQSDNFARIYDKGVKDWKEDAGLVWRFEVELKRTRAAAVHEKIISTCIYHEDKFIEDMVYAIVREWFLNRSIELPWEISVDPTYEIPKEETNQDKQLRWLEKQVRPSVLKLIDAGLVDETVEALGLAGLVD